MNLRLTMLQKLVLSYLAIFFSLIFALVYALNSMSQISKSVDEIAKHDLSAMAVTISIRENFIEQQRSIKSFNIERDKEYFELYRQEKMEFENLLSQLEKNSKNIDLSKLKNSAKDFDKLANTLFAGRLLNQKDILDSISNFEAAIEDIQKKESDYLSKKTKDAKHIKSETISHSLTIAFGGVTLSFFAAAFLIYSFYSSLAKLKKATHRIAEGDFDYDHKIKSRDEIGELADSFQVMAMRLKELEEISLDASPLTRLPGNIAIERSINHRLAQKEPFVVCYLDLDNFKSYNDKYGYIKASDLLKDTGRVIHEAVSAFRDQDFFVGHIGGDDFVVIISADIADDVCKSVIKAFDEVVTSYYSSEDRERGYIEGEDRYGVFRKFPIVSISIAALICKDGDFKTAAEIATAAAELKDRVKSGDGSNYLVVGKD